MQKRTLVSVLVLSVVLLAGITWVYAQQSGRSDSLTTQDHIDIQQLYARYYQTIDAGDAEGWAGTFTSDGVFNNVKGHDALAEFIRRAGANRPLRHLHSNLIVTAMPQGATGSVYVVQIDVKARPLTVASYSRYDDTLVKTPQGWRFKTRMRSADTTLTPANPSSVRSDRQ
jgi:hypothetical protein